MAQKQEISEVRRFADKVWRIVSGSYEQEKKNEIDILHQLYHKYFGKIPEVLNLGENYDNRKALSPASFNNDYWHEDLKGNTFIYTDIINMLDIMCSYETEKMQRVLQYTDDPVHLFFYDFKCYLLKLSDSKLDSEDIKAASHWQQLLRDILLFSVFEISGNTHKDTRVQVLFDLELIMREFILPKLKAHYENKAALEHLDELCRFFEKFTNIACVYLFYIARDSEYIPNFSLIKLQLLLNNGTRFDTLGLTESVEPKLLALKETLPLQLLNKVFNKSQEQLEQETLKLVSQENFLIEYKTGFNSSLVDEKKKIVSAYQLPIKFYEENKYFKPISLQYFISAHELLNEVNKFKQLFYAAKKCAEMGGNLLVFGLLKNQLLNDVHDCAQLFNSIREIFGKLDSDAWNAIRRGAKGETLSKNWKNNYMNGASKYSKILNDNCEHLQTSLSNLSAAILKNSAHTLLNETKRVVDRYLAIHDSHVNARGNILQGLSNISTMNLDIYHLEKRNRENKQQLLEDKNDSLEINLSLVSNRVPVPVHSSAESLKQQGFHGKRNIIEDKSTDEIANYESQLKSDPNDTNAKYQLALLYYKKATDAFNDCANAEEDKKASHLATLNRLLKISKSYINGLLGFEHSFANEVSSLSQKLMQLNESASRFFSSSSSSPQAKK